MKKLQITLLTLLAVATAITVGCGDGHSVPTFTKLPFVSDRTVDPATPLFIMNLDGTSVTPVQYSLEGIWSPTVSADFKKVAFASDGEVWASNSDGTSQAQLTSNSDSDSWSYIVRISPDGKKILFNLIDDNELFHMFIMNVDGSGKLDLSATLPDGMNGGCYTGSFSADSAKVVFACYGEGGYGLYTAKADGTSRSTVIAQDIFMDTPMFSPDGKKILFNSYGPSPAARKRLPNRAQAAAIHGHAAPGSFSNQGIVSVNLDGSNLTVLVANVLDAEILNSTLYYTFFNSDIERWQIYKANLDGTGAVAISDGTADDQLDLTVED